MKQSITFWRECNFSTKKFPRLQNLHLWELWWKIFAKKQNKYCSVFEVKQTITLSFQKTGSCLEKITWIPRIQFWRTCRKFFHQKSQVNVFKSGKFYGKKPQISLAFFCTLWLPFWQSWQKLSVKKALLV